MSISFILHNDIDLWNFMSHYHIDFYTCACIDKYLNVSINLNLRPYGGSIICNILKSLERRSVSLSLSVSLSTHTHIHTHTIHNTFFLYSACTQHTRREDSAFVILCSWDASVGRFLLWSMCRASREERESTHTEH
jgi:hypothetical protein